MALSRIVAIGDGSTTTFTVAFALGYLNEDDVTCRVGDESDGAGNPLYRTITWLTPTQAQISGTAPGIGERVIFDRTVPRDQLIVDFEDNDIINEENMNTAQKQALMLVHEVMDGRFDSLDTDIDLGGFRIINLGTPVEPSDAVNKAYVDTRITLAEGYATAAHNSAIAAASSASIAQGASLSANQAKDDAEDARDQVVIMYNTFTDIYSNFAGGTSGQVLAKASSDDFDYEWQTLPGTGDMLASVYDPQSIGDDAFDRANHTGTQGADTITGLADVAVSGDYGDLDNTPVLGSAAGASTSDFATAAQGAKADAAFPKSSFMNANLLADSGRFGGIDAITQTLSSFVFPPYVVPYNDTTVASAGKFITNNTDYGGSSGSLSSTVKDLIDKIKSPAHRRYGVEFFVAELTKGAGTASSSLNIGGTLYYVSSFFQFGPQVSKQTFHMYLRAIDAPIVLERAPGMTIIKDGVPNEANVMVDPSDGWVSITIQFAFDPYEHIGYQPSILQIRAAQSGHRYQMACTALIPGIVDIDDNIGVVASINRYLYGLLSSTGGNQSINGKLTIGAGPTASMDVATKQYVDTEVAANAVTSGKITSALGYTPAGFYTGSAVNNTNFPVGSIISVGVGSSLVDRNATPADPIRLAGTGSGAVGYTLTGTSTALSGTWRARGTCGSTGSGTIQLFQRTA